jgi:hypothetical protein
MEMLKFAGKVIIVIAIARVAQTALNVPPAVSKYLP